MARVSLYRKYRPQTFSDIVGQAHVTRTLLNALATGAVAHAYLFTGPRGTGKTTTARIFAKALVCECDSARTSDATCEQCREIAEGRHPDVYELDAASRTQVDRVREEIIERLIFPPATGARKLYIIDEVHMLSTHSFNALLKSIEEPPPRTVFVLCTTHPHKVPETIASRCQRFDFHRIGVDDIIETLERIAEAEGFQTDRQALTLVARHAAGGMRDAISTLEQVAAYAGSSITVEHVEDVLGDAGSRFVPEAVDLIADRDAAGLFVLVSRLVHEGVDVPEFIRALVAFVRDLYVISVTGGESRLIDASEIDRAHMERRAASFTPERLTRVLDVLTDLIGEVRWSSDPRLALELALARLVHPRGEVTLSSLAERVDALEAGAHSGHRVADRCVEPLPPAREATPVPDAALGSVGVKRAWTEVRSHVKALKSARQGMLEGTEAILDSDGETLVVEFPSTARFLMGQASEPDNIELLKRAMEKAFGFVPPFRFQLGRGPGGRRATAQDGSTGREAGDIDALMADVLGAHKVAEQFHADDEGRSERV